jgi:hypothetical protein
LSAQILGATSRGRDVARRGITATAPSFANFVAAIATLPMKLMTEREMAPKAFNTPDR